MTSPLDTVTSSAVKKLLYDKYILILGDSVIRNLYKDLIKFSAVDDLLTEEELHIKGNNRFYGDKLISGGAQKGQIDAVDYEEVREYTAGGKVRIRFYFLTRCYSSYIESIIQNDIKNQAVKPDIIIMNSCLLDISRYGILSMRSYQQNLDLLMSSMRQIIPDGLFLWLSALPVSNSSDTITKNAASIRPILPGLIRDGNYYCAQMCKVHKILYIDAHTILSSVLHLRQPDGVHWSAIGNRIVNEIILNHITAYYHGVINFKCLRLRSELGNKINSYKERLKSYPAKAKIESLEKEELSNEIKLKRSKEISNNNNHESPNPKRRRSTDKHENYQCEIKNKISPTPKEQQVQIKFDHTYSDVMYDNEFEGLHIAHFSSADIELSDIKNFQLLNSILQNHSDQIMNRSLKSSEASLPSMTLVVPKEEKLIRQDTDYIVLSSDDEDTAPMHAVPTDIILPIYLLNHL